MPAAIRMEMSTRDFLAALGSVPRSAARELAREMRKVGNQFVGILTKERLSGRPGLMRRTGTAARSFFLGVTGEDDLRTVALAITGGGNAAPYLGIHEEGGAVTGKPWLTIPLAPARTAAGASRHASARDVPDLFFWRSPSTGKAFLVKKVLRGRGKERKATLEPYYRLVRSVRIPARLGFFSTFRREAPSMQEDLQKAMDRVVTDFGKGA